MFVDRMSTLAHPEDEASANSRIVLAGVALEIFEQHPLLGVGFGGLNFAVEAQKRTLDEKQRVAHDTYLQVLVDSGLAAALLYVALLGFTIVAMGRSARFWGPLRPESAAIARGIQISLIAFAVGAPFYSCDRMDWPYMLILCGASWYSISARNAEELPPAGDDEVTVDATLVPEALS
jgi:O-antigen ligase